VRQEKNGKILKNFFYPSFLPSKTYKKSEKKAEILEQDIHL